MERKAIITTVATSLSILGCIVIFLAHKVWVDIRSNSRKILVYITIADLFTALGYLFGLQSHWKSACVFQSFVTTASSMMSFFWTTCMALYLYVVSIKVNTELGRRIIFLFHCIAWAVPLLITLVALLAGKLGKSCVGTAKWCWIKEDHCFGNLTSSKPKFESIMWMLVTGKFWEILSYIFILAVYARIFIYVRQQRKMVRLLLFFPLLLSVVFFLPSNLSMAWEVRLYITRTFLQILQVNLSQWQLYCQACTS